MKVTIYGKSANHPRFEQTLMKFATGVIDSGDMLSSHMTKIIMTVM